MRAVVQRVRSASVVSSGETVGEIGAGLCVLLGVTHTDTIAEAHKMAKKIAQLRILRGPDNTDDDPRTRVGASESGAPVLLISQFTLYADVKKGKNPSWSHAAPGPVAEPMFEAVATELEDQWDIHVEKGIFAAMMDVALVNDGPFTLVIDV